MWRIAGGIASASVLAVAGLTVLPQGSTPAAAATPNLPPTFAAAQSEWPVTAGAAVGTLVATLAATDPEAAPLTYSINAGNTSGTFAIDPATGQLRVAGPLTAGTSTLLGLTASDGTNTAQAQVVVSAVAAGAAGVTRQLWTGVSGSSVSYLTSLPSYPATPNQTSTLANFEAPTNAADKYGQRVIGYLVPPTTGAYTLSITSDDGGELWINPDGAYPAGAKKVASSSYSSGYVNAAPVTLQAGRAYLVYALHKESTGGDRLGVAWTGPGIATRTVIPGQHLLPWTSVALPVTAPTLTAVAQAKRVELSWTAAQTPGGAVSYRVFRDGTEVASTTGLTFSDRGRTPDTNYTYRVEASIASGSPPASSATVTTRTTNSAPVFLGAGGHYAVANDAPAGTAIGDVAATDPDVDDALSYRLVAGDGFAVDAATGKLTTSAAMSPTGATLRTITVEVTDGTATTVQKQFTVLVTDPVRLAHAGMLRQFWSGIGGYAVSALTADTRYPAKPDSTSVVPSAATPTNTADNFGDRLTGYLRPSVTGSYTFYLAANEAGELRLGPTSDPTSLSGAPIASLTSSATVNEWTKYPTQKSVAVTLVAGQVYSLEALHKEAVGSDHVQIGWQGPGMSAPAVITGANLLTPDALDSIVPAAPTTLAPSLVDARGVTVSWTAGTDANGISGYRVYRDGAPIGSVGSAARSYTDAGVTGRHDYAVVAVDAYGNTSAPTTLAGVDSATAFNAVEQAVASGSAAGVTDPASLVDAALTTIDTNKDLLLGAKAKLFNLNPDGTVKADGASLTSIGWTPTHDAALITSTYGTNVGVLRTNAVSATGYTVKDREIGVAGQSGPGRYLVLGGNPMRTALASAPNAATTDAGMHKFLENSMSWLTGRDDLTAAPFKVVIAQMDQSYWFPDEVATRTWLDAHYPGKVSYNAADTCDGAALAGCLAARPDLLIVSQFDTSGNPTAVAAAVKAAMAAGTPVMYLHHDGDLKPQGAALLPVFDVAYASDNSSSKLSLSGYNPAAAVGAVPTEIQSVGRMLTHFRNADWNVNLSGCSGGSCADATLQSEFYAGARDYLRSRLNAMDAKAVDLFAGPTNRLDKLLVLLGDAYRREVSYPMDKVTTSQDTFLRAYFADHAVLNTRTVASAQTKLGSFSKPIRADIPTITKDVSATTRATDHFTAATVYALPGRPFTVERTDAAGSQSVKVAINSLRSASTKEFDANSYTRPKYLTSPWVELAPGQKVTLTSPYGGPVQIWLKGSATDVTASLRFAGVGQHPVWSGSATTTQFAADLAAGDYDWAEFLTPGFQVHSTRANMLQTLANPVTNTPEKLAEVTTANFYQSIFNLAGFTGQSLSLDSKVSALCADKGWNCTDPAVHGMFGMWHFNSDQATCGYGCSGNPYDAWWAFEPLGWGDAHEVGHGQQRPRMQIDNVTGEVSNNIFPIHTVYSYNATHPTAPVHAGHEPTQAAQFTMLSDAARTADPKAAVHDALWVKGTFDRPEFYVQLAWQAQSLPQFGDGGWDLYTGLYLQDRLFGKAVASDAAWAAAKDGLGFGSYDRPTAAAISGNDWMLVATSYLTGKDQRPFFDLWGVNYSDKASAQVAAFGYPAAEKRFYLAYSDATGPWYGHDPVGSVVVDGTTTLP